MEVEPPRQPLHQLRALPAAEGPGGQKQAGVMWLARRETGRRSPIERRGLDPQMGLSKVTGGAVPRDKGSAASSGLVNHLLFFFSSHETNNKVQMEPA